MNYNTLEEYRATWMRYGYKGVEVYQASSGLFRVNTRQLNLGSVCVLHFEVESFEKESHEMETELIQTASSAEDVCTLFLPLAGRLRLNGQVLEGEGLCLLGPKEPMVMVFSEPCSIFCVLFKREVLKQHIGKTLLNGLMCCPNTLSRSASREQAYSTHKNALIDDLMSLLQCQVNSTASSVKQAALKLCLNLEKLLPYNKNFYRTPRLNTRFGIVCRALSNLDTYDTHGLTVRALSECVHCSVRSLEYSFKEVLGISPKKYLQLRCLHKVHQALMDEDALKVCGVLSKHGVVNQGRFSHQYKVLFGVYPKETGEASLTCLANRKNKVNF